MIVFTFYLQGEGMKTKLNLLQFSGASLKPEEKDPVHIERKEPPGYRSAYSDIFFNKSSQKVVLENGKAGVILNIDPLKDGHACIVLKRPVPSLKDLTKEERADIMDLIVKYQKCWESFPENKDQEFHYIITINDGKKAGQSIPQFHAHVLPIKEHLKRGVLKTAFVDYRGFPRTADEMKARLKEVYEKFTKNLPLIKKFAVDNALETRLDNTP